MNIAAFLQWLESTSLANRIRESLLLFPLLESAHVMALALVLGTIAVLDLRLLGFASQHRPFKVVEKDILKWTWAAFALSALTGSLMFTTNAAVYYHNFYFRTKMLLLVLAGVNMTCFELTLGRSADRWGKNPSAPRAGRVIAALSIVIWIAVIFTGRMIGFTTTHAKLTPSTAPPDAAIEDIFNSAPAPPK